MSSRCWVLLAVLLAAVACGGSTPSAPQPTSAAANIVFADRDELSAYEAEITSLLEQTLQQANAVLPVGSLQITVFADPARTVPGWGLGGYTLSGSTVEIVIDPAYPGLGQILPDRLPVAAAHEFQHTVRWRGPGPYATLLEALVFEGLADHFAIELLGSPIPPWSNAFPEGETEGYMNQARLEFDEPRFDFQAWFFGVGSALPQWTGYTLGFRLVRDYLRDHPGSTAAGLVDTPAEEFRPD